MFRDRRSARSSISDGTPLHASGRAARAIRRDGEHAGGAPLQRLIGAIEQRPRAGRIGSGSIEQRRLSRHRRGDVIERRGDGVDFCAHRSLDTRERLVLIVRSKPRALDRDARDRCQCRAHQAGQIDAAKRARDWSCAHGAGAGGGGVRLRRRLAASAGASGSGAAREVPRRGARRFRPRAPARPS